MFQRLGDCISKWWFAFLAIWIVAQLGLRAVAPSFDDLAKGGEFAFLPESVSSRQGEALLGRAFPGRQLTSSMVVVVHREETSGLTDEDRDFIEKALTPALEAIRDRINPAVDDQSANDSRIITGIHNFADPGIGKLLTSADQKATLVVVELALDFQDPRNWKPVREVTDAIQSFRQGNQLPKGLQLDLTGSATLGSDISQAETSSARNTATLTIVLVVVLLLVIYRAPLLALIPLLTLFIAVDLSLNLLALLAQHGCVPLFRGLKEYATVLTYGPGVDYCLFLIARYKENLNKCIDHKPALALAMGQVGSAIAASGATVICGIGMLTCADFGKFHDAGISISITLAITLIATLTLTPSLLALTGRWAFWPKPGVRCDDSESAANGKPAFQQNLFQPMWTYMGGVIERHPLSLLLATIGGMLPFIVFGVVVYGKVNYGLLESIPKSAPSVVGARVLESHFPAGITGPVTVLLQDSEVDFGEADGIASVKDLIGRLLKRRDELKLADIRGVSDPLGTTVQAADALSDESEMASLLERNTVRRHSIERYVSSVPELDGKVTELDVILTTNPFSMESVRDLDDLTSAIQEELKQTSGLSKATIAFVGPTASVRDLNRVSQSDQQRIYTLVLACVFGILVVLLRSIAVSVYLIGTVLLSYLATLGATWILFYCLDPKDFIGLDWTVPLFLFVVLIAVGEDYNIFLVSRIREEQQANGPKRGISVALSRTGGIITSCGFIMAGTFASLSAGSLARMQQLGIALALGVMLDTFIIRPILVPAFLMILNDERYGNLARYVK